VHGFMADFGEGNFIPPSPLFLRLFCERFFLCDLAPGFPILSKSNTHMRLHNNFSCAWLKTVASAFSIAAEQSGASDDFVAFARSGCISAAKHSRLFWAGDQLISWDSRDGIGSALNAVCFPAPISQFSVVHALTLLSFPLQLLSGGFFGRPVSHLDIGGYTNVYHPSNSSIVFNRSKVHRNIAMLLIHRFHYYVPVCAVYSIAYVIFSFDS
jgi:alpha-glucosidase (family GH31 glycosyl hydrolase)